MITAAEFEYQLKKLRYGKESIEQKKKKADELVISVLKQYGYNSGCYEWEQITKVYDSVKSDDRK